MKPMTMQDLENLSLDELKEFVWHVSLIIGVKNNTELSGSQAYKQIKESYKLLKKREIIGESALK
jgi:hypothetical protein